MKRTGDSGVPRTCSVAGRSKPTASSAPGMNCRVTPASIVSDPFSTR
ncbi:hypothetical protein [Nannocystis pusilla]